MPNVPLAYRDSTGELAGTLDTDGHGLFGGLICFRGIKAEYRAVNSKAALFEILDRFTEQVQETHVCPEFERRTPGAGYRG